MQTTLTEKISALSDYRALESFGKELTLQQILELLPLFQKELQDQRWKLPPILVGVHHPVFSQLLLEATSEQLETLKTEAVTEPVQHQITVAAHEIAQQINAFTAEVEQLEMQIQALEVKQLTHKEILAFGHALQHASDFYEEVLRKTNALLNLAWNSNRTDLIEKLSHSKELAHRLRQQYIGLPRSPQGNATGLYAIFDQKLQSAYGQPSDAEAVNDDEPALEALVKLSLWYPQDYWQVGLLPQITDPQLLERETELPPSQRQALLEKLLEMTRINLTRIGLNTAKDLKQAGICSKATLQEFVQTHLKN